eukprot:CAMPEP_0167756180 /NCGR_PEP_ID=MMETSP0110_2-20121227/9239_1 /TAXON_ID=629695 /ORGANISM="Gymnochlora sp., Strain CCMP2014" /LENGTH=362 /DNA_ID=CAMNT_0007642255 /DNA_START=49 /DNA_END=1137 /DNA_ORIENTATION=+
MSKLKWTITSSISILSALSCIALLTVFNVDIDENQEKLRSKTSSLMMSKMSGLADKSSSQVNLSQIDDKWEVCMKAIETKIWELPRPDLSERKCLEETDYLKLNPHFESFDELSSNLTYKSPDPLVIEKYKLIYIPMPKVGSTVHMKMLYRMLGHEDYHTGNIHDLQHRNKMKTLRDYSLEDATKMMHDPCWLKVVFLRDPMERMLSAYRDKGLSDWKIFYHSCGRKPTSFIDFLEVIDSSPQRERCNGNRHFVNQYHIFGEKWWPLINFIGDFKRREEDTRVLLEYLGVWDSIGNSGWGKDRTEHILNSTSACPGHCKRAGEYLREYYDWKTERKVRIMHKKDYEMFFSKKYKLLAKSCGP